MPFSDFLGNQSIVQTLQRQLRVDRLPHALLFAGPGGVGKKTLALHLAKALNCETVDDDFCDLCASCRKVNEHSHPDVRLYTPEGQFVKIDQMRELNRETVFRPFEGRRRVFIIEEADKLTKEAANSILKTIEEPPETSTVILVSEKANDLLPTIRSRAQLYQFAPMGPEEVERWLAGQSDYSPPDSVLLASISGGALGKASEIDLEVYKQTRLEMLDLLRNCSSNFAYYKVAKMVERVTSRKEGERELFEFRLEVLYGVLYDLLHLKVDESLPILNVDIKKELLALGREISFPQLASASQVLDRIELGTKRNLNRGLMVDQLVFRLSGIQAEE